MSFVFRQVFTSISFQLRSIRVNHINVKDLDDQLHDTKHRKFEIEIYERENIWRKTIDWRNSSSFTNELYVRQIEGNVKFRSNIEKSFVTTRRRFHSLKFTTKNKNDQKQMKLLKSSTHRSLHKIPIATIVFERLNRSVVNRPTPIFQCISIRRKKQST